MTTAQEYLEHLKEVENYIELAGLNTPSRKRHLVYQRYYLCAYLKEQGLTLESIGNMFGRDHSTAFNALKQHLNLLQTNDSLYASLTAHLREEFKLKKVDVQELPFKQKTQVHSKELHRKTMVAMFYKGESDEEAFIKKALNKYVDEIINENQ